MFRAHWFTVLFFNGGWVIMLVIGIVPHRTFSGMMPFWVLISWCALCGIGLASGIPLCFANVRVDSQGVASRHFRRWLARWDDIEAWSQHGRGNDVHIRTRDGRVRGFSHWCMWDMRWNKLTDLLELRVGPPATAEDSVMPPILKAIVGETMGTSSGDRDS